LNACDVARMAEIIQSRATVGKTLLVTRPTEILHPDRQDSVRKDSPER
jgi:hypothetical protein